MLRRAVFLDRDGTLNEDPGYLSNPEQLKLLPGVPEALASLRSHGFLLVVVSNQSGVGRGLIRPEVLPLIHSKLDDLLRPSSVYIDHYALCLHTPDDHCECRKPKPKLIFDAAQALGIDLSASYMVGDKDSDLGAGWAAGCKGSLLVLTGTGKDTLKETASCSASFVGESLMDVAQWIISQGSSAKKIKNE